MIKAFTWFYGFLTVLTIIGTVIVMGNSLQPLLIAIGGLVAVIICSSVAVAFHALGQIRKQTEYQTKLLKRRMKKPNGR